jgi:hypothetical protein
MGGFFVRRKEESHERKAEADNGKVSREHQQLE